MTLLQVRLNGRELESSVREEIDLGESESFEVTYELTNPSTTDDITNLQFVSNLPSDAYEIVKIPLELSPDSTEKATVRFLSSKLLQIAESVQGTEVKGTMFGSFTYKRKRKLII